MQKLLKINEVFGDLIIIKQLGVKKNNNYYLCKCSCGKERELKATELLSVGIKSCGCKNFVSKPHANQKFSPEIAGFRAKASNYKALAKKRNLDFTISIEETISLLQSNCFYCNSSPNNHYNVRKQNRVNKKNKIQYAFNNCEEYNILYNGIDRINNNLGYIHGNVVTCCTKCNTAKLNYSLEEFKEWIIQLYKNLIK